MKDKALRDRAYLDWLRTRPCLVTGLRATEADPVEAAHIGTRGRGIKSPDNEAIPLSHSVHLRCHNKGEITTLRELLPDDVIRAALRAYAREIYQAYKQENER